MLLGIFASVSLFLTVFACPESDPEPPCTCRTIGYHASIITCEKVDNEFKLEKSMRSMKSSVLPVRQMEIFESNINYLPSDLFKGLEVETLFIAGSSLVALSDSDPAFEGLEESLQTLKIHECTIYADWRWSLLRNLNALTRLELVKVGPIEVDEDVKDIAHLNITSLSLTQNSISFLHDTAFSTFHNMVTLSLKHNPIKVLKRSMFPDPALTLTQLILSYSKLQYLPSDLFTNMPKLISLSLAGNGIFTLDKVTFTPVWKQLKKIDLTDNPLRCDCRINWVLSMKFPKSTWAKCTEPKQIKDKELMKLRPTDLWC